MKLAKRLDGEHGWRFTPLLARLQRDGNLAMVVDFQARGERQPSDELRPEHGKAVLIVGERNVDLRLSGAPLQFAPFCKTLFRSSLSKARTCN